MRPAAEQWLVFARKDILSAGVLLKESDLTGPAVFHCQQAVEKVFKAILEEREAPVPRSHDLERLFFLIDPPLDLPVDLDMLSALSTFYIDSRYPPLYAFPDGAPSTETAEQYLKFAKGLEQFISQSC